MKTFSNINKNSLSRILGIADPKPEVDFYEKIIVD